MGEQDVQQALQGLQRAREIAAELRDRALRGEPWWDLPIDLWEQLRRNTAPAAYLLERRGEAFADEPQACSRGVRPRLQDTARGSTDPAPHQPLENNTAANGGDGHAMVPAPATATAFLLLHEAAQAFRGLIPQLGDGHATIATKLLHAVDHAWHAVSGEATAVHDLTQTLEAGDSQETVPALQCERSCSVGSSSYDVCRLVASLVEGDNTVVQGPYCPQGELVPASLTRGETHSTLRRSDALCSVAGENSTRGQLAL